MYKPYDLDVLKATLRRHEDVRLTPYRDSVGKLTIGVGHNLDDKGITPAQADMLLEHDIEDAERDLDGIWPGWRLLSPERQRVLLNMCFNLGGPTLGTFRRMFAALRRGDYQGAADEMRDSAWFRQVGSRAIELERNMRNGDGGE